MRALALVAALLASLGTGGPAMAEVTGLEHLTRRDQLLGWEAVGRVDLGRDSFCTGALIAPDLVVTAAHCMFNPQGKPFAATEITFRAGYAEGVSIRDSGVAQLVAHPGYAPGTPMSPDNLRHDVALLRLSDPIPAAVAAPFVVQSPGAGEAISVVSYAVNREESLSWQRSCDVLARQEGLIAMNRDVSFGSSGAPVLDRSGGRARIVSIISGGGESETGERVAYGMELPARVAELKALLAKAGAVPSTTGTGHGKSRDIGARFVRP